MTYKVNTITRSGITSHIETDDRQKASDMVQELQRKEHNQIELIDINLGKRFIHKYNNVWGYKLTIKNL